MLLLRIFIKIIRGSQNTTGIKPILFSPTPSIVPEFPFPLILSDERPPPIHGNISSKVRRYFGLKSDVYRWLIRICSI